ncbi:MAG: phosphotransferase [bacterium]|nr:phosphotransferase [bacterium]
MDFGALARDATRAFLGGESAGSVSLERIGHGESVAFRVDGRYFLRLHSSAVSETNAEAHSRSALDSELAWIGAIGRDTDLVVQEPIVTPAGERVVSVDGVLATMLSWIDGEVVSGQPSAERARSAGRLLATLQAHARTWRIPNSFERPTHEPHVARAALARAPLAAGERDLLERAVDAAIAEATAVARTPEHFGLVHADLHEGNKLFVGDEARPIDFGCCGFGYWLYDLAEGLLHLLPAGRRALVEGYGGLAPDAVRLTEGFFLLCASTGFAYQSARGDDIARSVATVCEHYATPYLAGESFLLSG